MEEQGKIDPATVHEFDEASKGEDLPEHVAKHKAKFSNLAKAFHK